MTRLMHNRRPSTSLLVSVTVLACSLTAVTQTRIERRNNSYTPQQDVQLGREAAEQVRQQMPLLEDERTEAFVERLGEDLIAEIPAEFAQPEFRYTFEVVNLREINAFALPGGPMFVNRGMIQAARTEGEVAGVMAHELSHVILRHGTAQATRGQTAQIGAIAGQVLGSILGGRTGAIVASGSELFAGGVLLKYSREFEREADLLGAQMMARAGYDPREMARMFQTIERQGGSRGPEWLSSHPNPGNRVEAINREAEMVRVDARERAVNDLPRIHSRLNQLPPAPTSEQVARAQQTGQRTPTRGGSPSGSGRAVRVEPPSSRYRTYDAGDVLRLSVPENWAPVDGNGTVAYAPEGGYVRDRNGASAFTHGIEIGVTTQQGSNLQQQTEQLIQAFARSNPQLRRESGYSRTVIDGRQGLTTTLRNVSEVTGTTEAVNVSTVQLRDGRLLYLLGVAPIDEASAYLSTFGRVRQTIQLADDGGR